MKPGTPAAPHRLWYLVLVLAFAMLTALNFNKPFGFFRESNPALVAITCTYWKQHPAFAEQHIPLYSYAFDANQPPATQFDNTITTFGYGWFAMPYYFSQLSGIETSPVMLRIFSLLMLAITLIILHRTTQLLLRSSADARFTSLLLFGFYLFAPVVAWYQVYGYVHETAVLPFYYFTWYSFLRYRNGASLKWLLMTALALMLAVQFDWLPVIQAAVICLYLLFKGSKRWHFVVPAVGIVAGVAYIVAHYAGWSSWHDYLQFMRWKFGTRTVGEHGPSYISFLPANLNLLLFYAMSYGLLALVAIYFAFKRKIPLLIGLMIATGVLHHLVFWGFSSEHDYATLKMAYPIAFLAAAGLSTLHKKTATLFALAIVTTGIGLYVLLHQYRRAGIYQDPSFLYKAGVAIRNVPRETTVFLNSENKYFPQVEFYAGRPYKMANEVQEALDQMKKTGIATAVYIEEKEGQFVLTPLTSESH